jgi:hypothetical protein
MGQLQVQSNRKPQQKPEQQQPRSVTHGKAGTARKPGKPKPRAAQSQEPDPQQLLGEMNGDSCVNPMQSSLLGVART